MRMCRWGDTIFGSTAKTLKQAAFEHYTERLQRKCQGSFTWHLVKLGIAVIILHVQSNHVQYSLVVMTEVCCLPSSACLWLGTHSANVLPSTFTFCPPQSDLAKAKAINNSWLAHIELMKTRPTTSKMEEHQIAHNNVKPFEQPYCEYWITCWKLSRAQQDKLNKIHHCSGETMNTSTNGQWVIIY